MSNELMKSHTQLEARISQLQQTQEKIFTLLEGFYSIIKDDVSTLHNIMPEIRSVVNRLFAMSKIQKSSIIDIRSTPNKLNAMIKCYFEKSSAFKEKDNNM